MKTTTILSTFIIISVFILLGHTTPFLGNHEFRATNESISLYDSIVGSNQVRIMKIQANMVVDTADELLELVDRAKAKGANTVLYGDSKLNRFGIGQDPGNRWMNETQKFVDGVKERDMDLLFMTITMGFCGSVISDDVDLTTGYPIKNQPLRRINGELQPVSTASVPNGGFERSSDNVPEGWTFQDAPGSRTFVDTAIKRSGSASFRAEAKNGAMSRIITDFEVKPFHQYTLRFWIKTENLTAQNLLAIVRDENNKDRNLTNLRLSTPKADGSRVYFNRPNNLTLDWTEMRIAFNSLNATRVNLGLSLFGGSSGKIWWDDVTILDTPVLNWLNRDDLPTTIKREDGSALSFGKDAQRPIDGKLGQSGFPGKYDTHHRAPKILIGEASSIEENEVVTISGYHALPTANGQVSCSWNHPEIYARMRMIHERLKNTYEPDGYLVNYSEIRTGGWEPSDTQFGTSGAALAASIQQAFKDLEEVAPDAQYYFWNDMVDPNHNAEENYYQVNNTLAESWTTLDPEKVIIATWWEGQKITDFGPLSLNFFADKGFEQVLGAFYDADVNDNYNRWQTAAIGVTRIVGNMYATWRKDYSKIEAFGDLWWTDTEDETGQTVNNDSISVVSATEEVSPGNTYNLDIRYQAKQERDIVVIFQQNKTPWANYGSVRETVSKGDSIVSIAVEIDETTPIEAAGYKWTVFIAPKGKNWNDRLYLESIDPVSCVAITNSDTTATPNENEGENTEAPADQGEAEGLSAEGPRVIKEVVAYPNPAPAETVTLSFSERQDEINVQVYNLEAKLVTKQNAQKTDELNIPVGALPAGNYLLRVRYDEQFKTIRILVE